MDAATFESVAALLLRFVSLAVAQGCYGATVAALKQKDAVSCVLCDAKPLDDGHHRELRNESVPQRRLLNSCQGREQRSRTSS